jgi:cell division protein FtsN
VSRDYKPTAPNEKSAGKGSAFFTGLLIGLLLGVGLSVGIVMFIKGGDSPFVTKVTSATSPDTGKADTKSDTSILPKDKNTDAATGKPRFDFYTILPGSETQVTEQEIKQKEAEAKTSETSENYFLQVGAFQNEQDADNQKAKLALLGLEAIVQTAEIPDKGVWHRVRVGPFSDLEQINKARGELTVNGFRADLIKVKTTTPNQ